VSQADAERKSHSHTQMHVKVACVQMGPVLGQPQESMAIASRLLEPFTVDSGAFLWG
jgi:hypothetical protein